MLYYSSQFCPLLPTNEFKWTNLNENKIKYYNTIFLHNVRPFAISLLTNV